MDDRAMSMCAGGSARTIAVATEGKEDIRISRFIAAFFVMQATNMTVKTVLPVPTRLYSAISMGFGAILGLYLLFTARPVMKRAFIVFLLLECAWGSLFLISLLMGNADRSLLMKDAFWTLGICIPLATCVYAIKDYRILYDVLLRASYLMTGILMLMVLFPAQYLEYNMSFSYALVLPVLFYVNEWFNTRRRLHCFLAITGILAILLYGARGSVLCVGVMLTVKFFLAVRKTTVKMAVLIAGAALLTLFVCSFDEIGAVILSLLERSGIYSRTIQALFQGYLGHSPERVGLLKYYAEMIWKKPITGWGLSAGWIDPGLGPHNMLVELLLALGFPLGGLACFVAITMWFRMFAVKNGPLRDLLIILASYNSVMYMVSGNFLENVPFFMFAMLCFVSVRVRIGGHSRRSD